MLTSEANLYQKFAKDLVMWLSIAIASVNLAPQRKAHSVIATVDFKTS